MKLSEEKRRWLKHVDSCHSRTAKRPYSKAEKRIWREVVKKVSDDSGYAYASEQYYADKAGYARMTAHRSIKLLIMDGLLSKDSGRQRTYEQSREDAKIRGDHYHTRSNYLSVTLP